MTCSDNLLFLGHITNFMPCNGTITQGNMPLEMKHCHAQLKW